MLLGRGGLLVGLLLPAWGLFRAHSCQNPQVSTAIKSNGVTCPDRLSSREQNTSAGSIMNMLLTLSACPNGINGRIRIVNVSGGAHS